MWILLLLSLLPQFKEVPRNRQNQIREYYLCKEVDCDKVIKHEISLANRLVQMQNYPVSHTSIGVSVFETVYRKIPVESILFQTDIDSTMFLLGNDLPVWLDTHPDNKAKIIIVDEMTVIKRKNDILEIYRDTIVASIYVAEFWKHKSHAVRLELENN